MTINTDPHQRTHTSRRGIIKLVVSKQRVHSELGLNHQRECRVTNGSIGSENGGSEWERVGFMGNVGSGSEWEGVGSVGSVIPGNSPSPHASSRGIHTVGIPV